MLLLLFHVRDGIYAIDTAAIIEIVPMVMLRKLPQAAEFIAGVFNYHHEIIPVIDLCQLIQGSPCRLRYSTRIIVIHYSLKDRIQRLGLMAERVTETLKQSEPLSKASTGRLGNSPHLGEVFMHEENIIQQINWESFVLIAQNTTALIGGSLQTNGAGCN